MNKAEITNRVMKELSGDRLQAALLADANFNHAMNHPEFNKLEKQKRALTLSLATAKGEEAKKIRQTHAEVEAKQNLILGKLGLSRADIQARPKCKECADNGIKNGKFCACVVQKVNKRLMQQSGLDVKDLKTFDDVDEKLLNANPKLGKIYRMAKEYALSFPNNKLRNMIIIGEVGVGKTFLLECIANEVLSKNHFVVMTTAFALNRVMTGAFLNKQVYERKALLEPILDCDLLVIDDLGSETKYDQEAMVSNLFTVLNERLHAGKHTIVSSNLEPTQIEDFYGNRIVSRLFDTRNTLSLRIVGDDLRIKK